MQDFKHVKLESDVTVEFFWIKQSVPFPGVTFGSFFATFTLSARKNVSHEAKTTLNGKTACTEMLF